MKTYHKIQTIFHRDYETNNKYIVEGKWALPEFEMLKDLNWIWTEKIDGTNIRIKWDGVQVRFGGKTDNAQIPVQLIDYLQDTFTNDKMLECFGETPNVCLYGEGYGKGIQKGGNYIPDKTKFILFDCKIDQWWLLKDNVTEIGNKLGISLVPNMGSGSLLDAVELVKNGFISTISDNRQYMAEGLILKPEIDLFNRKGERIITKLKYKDFPH